MEYNISVLKIIQDTIVDGTGFRTSIYCAGCSHKCEGCHNKESWDIKNGIITSITDIFSEINSNSLSNVTYTGGDPMLQAKSFYELSKLIKEKTEKNIWCYTGFKFEELKDEWQIKLLNYIDVLVDGRFDKNLTDDKLRFKGSSNQRIIDVKESRKKGKIILWEDFF